MLKYYFKLKFLKKSTHDCFICATKPGIIFSLGMIYIALPECPHSNPVKKGAFKKSLGVRILNTLYITIFLIGIIYFVIQISRNPTLLNLIKHNLVITKLLNSFCFTLFVHFYQNKMMKYTTQLMKLLEKRKYYGIETLLTTKNTRNIHNNTLFVVIFTVIYISYFIFSNLMKAETFIDIWFVFTMSFNYMALGSLALFLAGLTDVYRALFTNFYKATGNALNERLLNKKPNSNVNKIQLFQDYYLRLSHNYNQHTLSIANILYYVEIVFCVVVVSVQTYLYYTFCLSFHIDYSYVPFIDVILINFAGSKYILYAGDVNKSVS